MASNGDSGKAPSRHSKQSSTAKTMDVGRKGNGSPIEQQARKQAAAGPAKAWQGPNPITSRSNNNTPPLTNGVERSGSKANTRGGNTDTIIDKHAHDRMVFLLANMTGYDATLTLKSGERFTGVFAGGSFESNKSFYTLKMVKRVQLPAGQQINGNVELSDEYTGEGEDHTAHFDVQDTAELSVNDVQISTKPAQNGTASSFRTDTEISRGMTAPRERELQRWEPSASDNMSLDDMTFGETTANGWDQFAANEQKYGVQTTYDEDIYTTTIDKSHPQYQQRMAEAERKAREIEGSVAPNAHVAEERRKDIHEADDGDEEDKYSGVRRDVAPLPKGGTGSYVPPSRRPITATPTVPGAPFDPAIISSQIARPAPPPAEKPVEKLAADAATIEKVPSPIPAVKATPGTTEDRVRDTADAFKQFASNEKLRIRQAQELKRTNARNEKNVRINDLKKFAENFKLKSRVPEDLVPILAKDHDKQQEIKRKAEEAARVEEAKGKDAVPASSASSSATVTPQGDRAAAQSRQRVVQNRTQYLPQPIPGMSQRQAQVFGMKAPPRQSLPAQNATPNVTIPTGPAAQNAVTSPSPVAANKLNVNAKAFEFKPAASVFTPGGVSPSPQRVEQPAKLSFFDDAEKAVIAARQGKPVEEEQDTDVIAFLRQEASATTIDELKKSFASNGGIPQPYRTAPTWAVPEDRQNTNYEDMFPRPMQLQRSPMQTPNGMPQGHQLPPNMAGSAPQPRFYPQPGMHYQFDPRMQPGGPGASLQSSPRFQQAQFQMGPQMGQMPQMHMQQYPGQPMPIYGMSPNMSQRALQMPQGQQPALMMPQGYGPSTPMRQPYAQAGQFPNMMPQGPAGFMPQQGYSPMPQNGQQHMMHMQPGMNFSGSPRPGPHMMQHGGSHQGFQPHHVMQGVYPGQPSPYAMNQRQMSAGQFPQQTPRQSSVSLAGGPMPSPGMNGPNGQSQGEDAK